MQREIKFRAWDGKRITTSGIMFNTSTSCITTPTIPSFNPDGKEKDFYQVMQYTGLKDKDGVDIYEGDICETRFGLTVVIQYDNYCAAFKPFLNEYPMEWRCYILRVIGNIYANPELLN